MARRVFFSFHYDDVTRVNVVRNSDRIVRQYERAARFHDASLWEEAKKQGRRALKRMINDGLHGTSVTCVLVGQQTWERPWVRYEILKSFARGNGILAVQIHDVGFAPGDSTGELARVLADLSPVPDTALSWSSRLPRDPAVSSRDPLADLVDALASSPPPTGATSALFSTPPAHRVAPRDAIDQLLDAVVPEPPPDPFTDLFGPDPSPASKDPMDELVAALINTSPPAGTPSVLFGPLPAHPVAPRDCVDEWLDALIPRSTPARSSGLFGANPSLSSLFDSIDRPGSTSRRRSSAPCWPTSPLPRRRLNLAPTRCGSSAMPLIEPGVPSPCSRLVPMDIGASTPSSTGFRSATCPGCLRPRMPRPSRPSFASTTGKVTAARRRCRTGSSGRLPKWAARRRPVPDCVPVALPAAPMCELKCHSLCDRCARERLGRRRRFPSVFADGRLDRSALTNTERSCVKGELLEPPNIPRHSGPGRSARAETRRHRGASRAGRPAHRVRASWIFRSRTIFGARMTLARRRDDRGALGDEQLGGPMLNMPMWSATASGSGSVAATFGTSSAGINRSRAAIIGG